MSHDYLMVIRDVLQHELNMPHHYNLNAIDQHTLAFRHKHNGYVLLISLYPHEICTTNHGQTQRHAYEDPNLIHQLQQRIDDAVRVNERLIVFEAFLVTTALILIYSALLACVHVLWR